MNRGVALVVSLLAGVAGCLTPTQRREDDLMREADEGALDLGGGHEAALLAEMGLGGRLGGFSRGGRIAHGVPFMISADGPYRGERERR